MVLRSMTRAAEALGISQPAVSRLMRDMEINLRLTLFRRRKGGLQPTEEALALYAEVERSFVGVGKIERAAIRIRERQAGNLRICGMPALMHSFLPHVVEVFLRDDEGVAVALHTFDADIVIDQLRTRQYDIGYVMTPADTTGVIDDLRDEPFISLAEGTMTRLKIDAAFEAANVTRRLELEAFWSATICSMVERGLGLSIIEPFTAEDFAARGGTVRPFEPAIDFSFVQVRQARALDPPLVTSFLATLEQCLAPRLIR